MADTIENKRRWSGFVCPDCRFVFRVPRDHDGRGVICPSCRRMLKIPVAGDPVPPLVEKTGLKITPVDLPESIQRMREKRRSEAPAGGDGFQTVQQPEVRRRRGTAEDDLDWEKASEKSLVRVGKKHGPRWGRVFAVGLAVLSLLGALVILTRREKPAIAPVVIAPVQEVVPIEPPVEEEVNLPLEMSRNEVELLAELKPLTQQFLDAKTVDEMLPLVRDRAKVEPKMRKFYPDGKIAAPGMGEFNTMGAVAYRGKLASVAVRTGDFESKQLAFFRTKEGMKIDWESYVGWSEMSWQEFITRKPETPVLFRIILRSVDYYNFGFSDELTWRSYQVQSSEADPSLYAYVKRGTPMDGALLPAEANSTSLVIVRLKFPEGEKKNQVLVDSVVADGWVEGTEN